MRHGSWLLAMRCGWLPSGCQTGLSLYSGLMPKRFPEFILLALIFLAVGIALTAFIGPFLRMLGLPS
ncbi:hypothetical protein LJR098_001999 [Rhizobium sp. LjRoot98]|uniref:hypothetical protein n=1 Tax=unclassified Rhizobium TaxID=2613769 RepID=UPI000712833F|nr:hypothetical protein [Rhizobium sp. Root1204]KQV38727.1 hypothetical protein ASC96_25710 [Rhizobium sp. Root1204]